MDEEQNDIIEPTAPLSPEQTPAQEQSAAQQAEQPSEEQSDGRSYFQRRIFDEIGLTPKQNRIKLRYEEHVIYATGGGYPCWEDNMECLRELGTSIYLRWKPEHLAKRLSLTDLSERPILQGKTEEELLAFIAPQLEAREPFYSQAHHILDVEVCDEQSDERIAEELFRLIRERV